MGFADDPRIEQALRQASELPWFARTLMVFERAEGELCRRASRTIGDEV
jgi:hypothetical protein